jgi:hypothetical protein
MPQNEATSRLRLYDAIQGALTAKQLVDKQLNRENDIIDLQSISTIHYYVETLCMSTPGQCRTDRLFKLGSIDLYAYILSFLVPKGKLDGKAVNIFTLMNIEEEYDPKTIQTSVKRIRDHDQTGSSKRNKIIAQKEINEL